MGDHGNTLHSSGKGEKDKKRTGDKHLRYCKRHFAGITYFDTYHPGKPMAGQRLIDAYEKPLNEYYNLSYYG